MIATKHTTKTRQRILHQAKEGVCVHLSSGNLALCLFLSLLFIMSDDVSSTPPPAETPKPVDTFKPTWKLPDGIEDDLTMGTYDVRGIHLLLFLLLVLSTSQVDKGSPGLQLRVKRLWESCCTDRTNRALSCSAFIRLHP